jgi:peptidoglycan/xylan/chitin deacetylase (PgdA/CDA1 family)
MLLLDERRAAAPPPDPARRAQRRWLAQTVIGLLALPLSLIPLWLYSTRTDAGHLIFLKARYSLLPPSTPALSPAARSVAMAHGRVAFRGVPVLNYHGIGRHGSDTHDARYVVTRSDFAEHMMSLRAAGYTPIDTDRLRRYLRTRDRRTLPPRPIVITFDDGRVDAMLQGDRILRDSGMRATMFAIGGASNSGSPYYQDWAGLADYVKSGRWELANHTYDLHNFDGEGRGAPSALVSPQRGESLDAYAHRVRRDLARADAVLARHGATGREAFAYPFSDWGQRAPAAVRRTLRRVLAERFAIAFDQDVQEDWRPTLPGDDPLHLHRLTVESWTGPQLLRRLERGYRLARSARRS